MKKGREGSILEVESCPWSMVDTEFCGMSESLVLRPGSVSWSVAESVRTPLRDECTMDQ